jgi:hypothetical protein
MFYRSSSRGSALLPVAVWVIAAILAQPASGLRIFRTDIGDGADSFKFAIITDLHITDDRARENLHAAVDTINALATSDGVLFTMVTGDLTNGGFMAPGADYDEVIDSLENLVVPYVPLIGNHDLPLHHDNWVDDPVKGQTPESLFHSRGFLEKFGPVLTTLENRQSPPIDSFKRYTETPWNWRLPGWGVDGAHDAFENYAFRAGPAGSPYRFLCLDFVSRDHDDGYLDNVNAKAHLYDMFFHDSAGSVRVVRKNDAVPASCTLYVDSGYDGDKCYFDSGVHNLDQTFYRNVGSVRFGDNCDSVILYTDSNCMGNRLELLGSDSSLTVNGPEQWWRDYVTAHRGAANNFDKLIVFAHNTPAIGWFVDGEGGFSGDEAASLTSFCQNAAGDIGAWFGGHITPGCVLIFWPWGKQTWIPSRTAPWGAPSHRICYRWLDPPCGGATDAGDGSVNIVTLRWDPNLQPLIVADESGIFPEAVDATMDTAHLVAVIADEVNGRPLSADIYHGTYRVVTLLSDSSVSSEETISIPWDCTDSTGKALPPDDDYCVRFREGTTPRGTIPFRVRGTAISGNVNCVLDTSDNPVQLAGNVTVNTGDTLLIRPGVRVMPSGDYGITVHGRLLSNGLPGDTGRILFTPYRRLRPTPDSCEAGAWKGIKVTGDGLCSLNYCAIEYAGGTADSAAVFCDDSSQLVMTNSVIRHSSSRGFYGHSDRDVMNRIYGDTFEYCASYPVTTVADSVHSIVQSCTFRNNGTKGIEVWAGSGSGRSVTASAEWLKCESTAWSYDITEGALDVWKADSGLCTLKVAPGVTIRFKDGQNLVLHDEGDREGYLLANGTSENPITFTGLDTMVHDSFWHGIHFQSGADGHMDHCNVTHVDGRGMEISSGTVHVHNSLIRRVDNGIWTGTNALTVTGTTFSQCSTGLYAYGSSSTVASLDYCTFSDNYDYGLFCTGDEDITATHCSFNNNDIPAAIRADKVAALMTGASFSGNTFKGVEVSGGTIGSDTHVWPAIGDNYIYRCSDDITMAADALLDDVQRGAGAMGRGLGSNNGKQSEINQRSAAFSTGPVLEVGPGVTLEFATGKRLKIGASSSHPGTLKARGYANAKITFRCYDGGYWDGIGFLYSDSSVLRHCVVDRAGLYVTNDHAAINCNQCSPSISWTLVSNADTLTTTRGMYATNSQLSPSHCVFANCGRGIEYGINADSPTFDSCEFLGNYDGIYIDDNDDPVNVSYSNFIGNTRTGVYNSNTTATAYAQHCYWNNPTSPYGPNGGDTIFGLVETDPALSESVAVNPPVDVAARRPIAPIDTVVSDTALTFNQVYGYVKNYYPDSLYEVPVTMTIGSVYEQTVLKTIWAGESCLVDFPDCYLDAGTYTVRLSVSCVGDSNQSNDTIYDTLVIRRSIDAAALAVVQPGSPITVDDSIAPTALIANYSDSTRTVPVKFYIDTYLRDSIGVSVGPHETAQAVFSTRTFPPGQRQVRYICSLPLDDNRHNDTVSASVTVDAGDYWVTQDSPPYASARMCWDKGQYLYAAERTGSGVSRFGTLANDWSAVADPPVETVFGITTLKGQVYVLGNAASWGADEGPSGQVKVQTANIKMQNAAQSGILQDTGEGRGQRLEARVQSKDARQVKVQDADIKMQNAAQSGTAQDANREQHGGAFSNELGIYRYIADGDSWELVTTCDTTLVPGNGSALVGDDAGSIYLIEGGTDRVLRYVVAADSWVPDTASQAIDRWGAAAWSRGKLYALADTAHALKLDPATGQWTTINLDLGDANYGTALCADPVLDRLFAFCHRAPWYPFGASPFRERLLRSVPPSWSPKASLTDSAGAALCFGSTQAYCLDGRGGFWRYRPEPLSDVAAAGFTLPDTIPCDSQVSNIGIVQNTSQDTLGFEARLVIGAYRPQTVSPSVAPQQWDTVAFNPGTIAPGSYLCTLTVTRWTGPDLYRFNDTARQSLVVRVRTDAQAMAVLSPQGRMPYDGLITPQGRVRNNSDSTLSGWVRMTIGTEYADSLQVALPALAETSIVFDTCHLRLGEYQAVLRVRYDGDEVPGNDTALGSFEVVDGDYWKALAQCPASEVRLVGSPGSDVYSVERSGTDFRFYDAAQDTWEDMASSPLGINLSLCRQGNEVYALGWLGDGLDDENRQDRQGRQGSDRLETGGMEQNPTSSAELGYVPRPGRGQTDGPPAIARYDVNTDAWDTVSAPLSFMVSDGSCLFATDDTTLFVLSLGNNNLWRYITTQTIWVQMTPMPGSVSAWASGAYDEAGHFYVLTDGNGKLRKYNVAGNTWDSLTPLNDSTPSGSALCCDPAKNVLYALWAASGASAFCYDISGNTWTAVESFPTSLYHPALAQCGDNPYGQDGTTFAKYVPEPELDVAALEILVPGDTERYDSAVVPTGVVHNLSEAPVWCQATLTLGNLVRVLPSLYLEPGETDTVAFDTTYLPAGRITATLDVTCAGDANPGNDTCSKPVQVEAPWEPRDQSNYAQGRLDADTGVSVYFGPRSSAAPQKYVVSEGDWSGLPQPPFISYCLDLAHYDGALYALGLIGLDGAPMGRKLGTEAGPGLTTHPAIYRHTPGDTVWTLVTESLPVTMLGTCPWIAATGPGIYLEPGWGRAFFRHDSSQGWTTRDSLPTAVVSPVALDWDRDDEIFLLGAVSAESSAFFGYSISGDSWVTLTTTPVQPLTGVAIVAEPGGNTVLALMPADTGHALLYGYDRSQDTWTLMASPTWAAGDGAAMTWAGNEAYALTGYQTTQPSWFWCYDPGFAAYWGRGLEGVAGNPLPLFRWQLTCAPNPLSARTVIRWQVPRLSSVSLKVYNTAGQMVRVLSQGRAKPGSYTATWNGCDQQGRRLAAGVYVCTLDGPGTRITRKVVLTQ